MADLPPGSRFAGYRIEDVAGRGGMGIVYRATDLSLDRPVALKFIAAELVSDPDFRRRFTAESRSAASLDHPNVVPIYHAGEHNGALFLVMRFVEGDDLRSEIAESGPLQADRVVHVMAQIASALDAAHAAGLVHRDVKPANILVTHSDHAYLTDFGLTKRLRADGDQTETGRLLGTLDYVAPEQIRGEGVDARTDVYALGCVLYHALAGRVPFTMKEQEAKLWAHVSQPPPPLGPGLPEGFDEVIARAMAKEPSGRFDSAGALAAAASDAARKDARRPPGPTGRAAEPPTGREPPKAPVARPDDRPALLRHALLSPFSLAVLLGTLIAGALFSVPLIVVPVAFVVYGAAAAVIYFDDDVRREVLGGDAGEGRSAGRPTSPRIADLLEQARDKRAQIRDAIKRGNLPYAEVLDHVDGVLAVIQRTAGRAESLQEGLAELPRDAQEQVESELERYFGRMERVLGEFDTIRGQLTTAPLDRGADEQDELTTQVHHLRREAGAMADAVSAAYAEQAEMREAEDA